ncbi:MAG: DUF4835 family protein [Pedobacter sp.]|nr:MAG: DUF4835 family protein [Pedobacter sp.]
MKKLLYLLLIFSFISLRTQAQELNARVQVLAPQISNLNNRQIEGLQNQIRDFLNQTKWTNESYNNLEKIDCSFTITLTKWDGNSSFTAEALIQSSRPVYGTSYQSTLLNINDKDFNFTYYQGQIFEYSDQNYFLNLSSLLAYYAYTIIGLDKDAFYTLAGEAYYLKAQNVLNLAQTGGNLGWKASDGLRNRFWLNENLLNPNFKLLREFLFEYHFNVLDHLAHKRAVALKNFGQSIQSLNNLDKQKIGSYFPNVYFAAKAEEVSNLLQLLPAAEKLNGIAILSSLDPANINKYTVPTTTNSTESLTTPTALPSNGTPVNPTRPRSTLSPTRGN